MDNIRVSTSVRQDHNLVTQKEEYKLSQITQKILYEETLLKVTFDHHSQYKWVQKLDQLSTHIVWEDVWNTVHNFLSTNKTKNVIWQQIHLNFYTQYSYNKWHRKQEKCPLCSQIPKSIFHIILHCNFTNTLWNEIEPLLMKLHPVNVNDGEKAFGVVIKKHTTGSLLRNWLTFKLREHISQEERLAYHSKPTLENTKLKFNNSKYTTNL